MTTRGVLVFACAVSLVAAACSSAERVSVGGASTTTETSTTAPTSTSTPSTTTTPATSTTTTTGDPTPGPPVCAVDPDPSGPLLEFGVLPQSVGTPPPGWGSDQAEFDWNGDGHDDALVLVDETVVVDWDGGSLTISGVRVDFSDEPETEVTPAAVADVTGDARPDLILANDGEVAVVVGGGTESVTVEADFVDVGEGVNGWRSPPVELTPPGEEPVVEPLSTATVLPLWDVTGDGIADYSASSIIRRANGRFFVYAGKPCG